MWWVSLTVTVLLCGRQLLLLVVPYFTDGVATTLREDDYWAYSSGFRRRALLGELLYRVTNAIGTNASALCSLTFVAVYGLVTWRALPWLTRSASLGAFAVFCATPIVMSFTIDREVLLLVPVLAIVGGGRLAILGCCLVPVACLVHELALVLYSPCLLALHVIAGPWRRWSAYAFSSGSAIVVTLAVFARTAPPTYDLELFFWPTHGVDALLSSHLYGFADMPAAFLLRLHGDLLLTREAYVGLAFGVLLVAWLYHGLQHYRALRFALVTSLLPFMILSIDYGRYAYFLAAFYALAERAAAKVTMHRAVSDVDDALEGAVAAPQGAWLNRGGLMLLLPMLLAPVGFWVRESAQPSLFRVVFELRDLYF